MHLSELFGRLRGGGREAKLLENERIGYGSCEPPVGRHVTKRSGRRSCPWDSPALGLVG